MAAGGVLRGDKKGKIMQKTTSKTLAPFKKPSVDPEFYAAKAALRKTFPKAMMIELISSTAKIVLKENTIEVSV